MNKQRGKTLSSYEKMGGFELVDELPKTPIGKIDKKVLIQREEENRVTAPAPANDWVERTAASAASQRATGGRPRGF